jgi:hypothetical protein
MSFILVGLKICDKDRIFFNVKLMLTEFLIFTGFTYKKSLFFPFKQFYLLLAVD